MASTFIKALVFVVLQMLMLASSAQAGTSLAPNIRVRPHLIDDQMRPHGSEPTHTDVQRGPTLRYAFDGSGKITKKYASYGTWRFEPDEDKTQTYTSMNRLDQYGYIDMDDGNGAQDQDYDGAGNLTDDGSGRTYTYDTQNQLIRAQGAGLDMEYWYDALGRRSHSLDHIADIEVFHKHYGQMHPKGTSSLSLTAEVGDYTVCRKPLVSGQCPSSNTIGVGKVHAFTPTFRMILGQGIDNRIAYHDVDGDDISMMVTNHQGSLINQVEEVVTTLMDGELARMVFADPPYNVVVNGNVCGKGTQHAEFAMASGEISKVEFIAFLTTACENLAVHSHEGSIHFICMDWRHISEMMSAGLSVYFELKNMIV